MSIMKARISGAWVDTAKKGSVRLGGVSIPYHPESSEPTYESLSWPNAPSGTNFSDGDATYNMGLQFYLLTPKPCVGVRWRVPDSIIYPNGDPHEVSLWNASTQERLAFKQFEPITGGYQDILFDTPVSLSANPQQYVVMVFTNHYVYSAPTPTSGWILQSPSLNLKSEAGKLAITSFAGVYPDITPNSWYYVAPIVQV